MSLPVTAQKQEENIQEVPISISLIDEYAIEDNNIRTISDVALFIPNFQQFSVGGAGMYAPAIRGLSADVHTISSTVATYVDGIPYLSSMGNDLIIENIERVEVLRGPQGTLYGKNAYSGVVKQRSTTVFPEMCHAVRFGLNEKAAGASDGAI